MAISNQNECSRQTLILIDDLESALKAAHLWHSAVPPVEALQSVQPFCIDTLLFDQWLQFVFIEKMHFLIENNQALPSQISIEPMASEAFKANAKAKPVIETCLKIDLLLGAQK